MSQIKSRNPNVVPIDIDAVLQDTYLLVVELQQGSVAQVGQELCELCVKLIEGVREQLVSAGLSQRSIDHISHAQCALLDETVLRQSVGEIHAAWAREPLQAQFFSRHQAGESLYEDMREVLREPAPDRHVLTVFQRMLMLGFQGRYREADDPEREQLLATLHEQVEPLQPGHRLRTQVHGGRRIGMLPGLQTPMSHALATALLFGGVWWALDRYLGGVISTFMSVQA